VRAMISIVPPAGNGTTNRTAAEGNSWAEPAAAVSAPTAATSNFNDDLSAIYPLEHLTE
jgi:hypothetical protein